MFASRERKLAHFYAHFREGMTVLDVGVTSELKAGFPARNHFLKTFRGEPGRYTGLGVDDLSEMEQLFPGKRFVSYPGGRFPFGDTEFDWVFSNAVIEHVGKQKEQLFFINEMLRVGRRVFFTTPNKFFPLDSHTNSLFLHWHYDLFMLWCRKYRKYVLEEGLYLLSSGMLDRLLRASNAARYTILRNRLAGLTMTFSVMCSL
jgi:hypothetical protein